LATGELSNPSATISPNRHAAQKSLSLHVEGDRGSTKSGNGQSAGGAPQSTPNSAAGHRRPSPGRRSCSCRIVQSFWLKHLEQTGHDDQPAIVDFGRSKPFIGQIFIQLRPAEPGGLARLIDGAANSFAKME